MSGGVTARSGRCLGRIVAVAPSPHSNEIDRPQVPPCCALIFLPIPGSIFFTLGICVVQRPRLPPHSNPFRDICPEPCQGTLPGVRTDVMPDLPRSLFLADRTPHTPCSRSASHVLPALTTGDDARYSAIAAGIFRTHCIGNGTTIVEL